jgi:hypothetical protein
VGFPARQAEVQRFREMLAAPISQPASDAAAVLVLLLHTSEESCLGVFVLHALNMIRDSYKTFTIPS